jgi:hypothetical protein
MLRMVLVSGAVIQLQEKSPMKTPMVNRISRYGIISKLDAREQLRSWCSSPTPRQLHASRQGERDVRIVW